MVVRLQEIACAYRIGNEGVGHGAGDLVRGLPAGAVAGNDIGWANAFQGIYRRRDDLLEQPAAQVKATDHGVYFLHARDGLRVADDVDNARMPAPCYYDQPFAFDVHDRALVVHYQGIRLPMVAAPGIMHGEASLELGGARHLTGYEYHIVNQHRGTHFLYNLNILPA